MRLSKTTRLTYLRRELQQALNPYFGMQINEETLHAIEVNAVGILKDYLLGLERVVASADDYNRICLAVTTSNPAEAILRYYFETGE